MWSSYAKLRMKGAGWTHGYAMPHSSIAKQPTPPSTHLSVSDTANKHHQHFAPLPRCQRCCRLGGRFAGALPPLRWHALRQRDCSM